MTAISLFSSSVEPINAIALTNTTVKVTWYSPNPSDFSVLRLVRSQYAFSETQEDGDILYEYIGQNDSDTPVATEFVDGVTQSLSTVQLVSGQYAYYSVWLLLANSWKNAGQVSVLIPEEHGVTAGESGLVKSTHLKVMEMLPRVLTSVSNSPFDEVDQNSDLFKFMKGFSLAYDELLTLADLTSRSYSAKYIPDNIVLPSFKNLGLRVTSTDPTSYKKSLISKAPYLLATKGTKDALQGFIEAYTGFNAVITDTAKGPSSQFNYSNLLLNAQDSNFHKGGLGAWKQISNVTLSVENSSDIPTTQSGVLAGYSFKSPYRLKVVTANNGILSEWRLGGAASRSVVNIYESLGDGIPVEAGKSYSFNWAMELGTGTTPSVKPYIKWYDTYGTLLSTSTPANGIAPTSSWVRNTYTASAPGKKAEVESCIVDTFNPNATPPIPDGSTTVLATAHGFSSGDTIFIEDEYAPFNGLQTISSVTTNSFEIPFSKPGVTLSSVSSAVVGGKVTFTIGTGNAFDLVVDQQISILSGTGTLGGVTKVVEIVSSTTFIVDIAPTVALSSATILGGKYPVDVAFTVFKANSGGTGKETPAKYALVGFTQTARLTTFYMSSFQFAVSGTAGFIEARCIDVYLEPSKVNYLVNPNFDINNSWTTMGSGATLTVLETSTLTGVPYAGVGKMGKLVTSSSSSSAAVPDFRTGSGVVVPNNNTYYTFSIYLKGDAPYTLKLGLNNSPSIKETTINVTTSWQRFSVTLYVTNSIQGIFPYIYGTRSAVQTIRMDNAQLEEGQKATDYFDGNFFSQDAMWVNGSNQSASYLYVNKNQKMSELLVHMNDWVPLGSTWMVRSQFGIEAIGLPTLTTISSESSYSDNSGGGIGLGNLLV